MIYNLESLPVLPHHCDCSPPQMEDEYDLEVEIERQLAQEEEEMAEMQENITNQKLALQTAKVEVVASLAKLCSQILLFAICLVISWWFGQEKSGVDMSGKNAVSPILQMAFGNCLQHGIF